MREGTAMRVRAAILSLALTAGLATACGQGSGDSLRKSESDGDSGNAKLQTLKVFVGMSTHLATTGKTYNDNLVFQEMEKRTGIKVEWIHPPAGQGKEKFNLMLSSMDLPDVIVYDLMNAPGGVSKYADDGVIIPLNDLIDKYAPNYKKYLDTHPEIRKNVTAEDGNIYYFTMLRVDPTLRVFMGPQIRKDWLDKLQLPVPTTTDELYQVLKAFKEKDPNGNGKADEIPYSGVKFKDTEFGIGKLLWPFGVHYSFYQDNGQVKFGPLEPGFKEGMLFIQKLYKEGLLDPDYVLLDRSKLDGKVMNHQVGALYHYQMQKFMDTMRPKDPNFNIVAMPHLKGPNGTQSMFEEQYIHSTVPSNSAAITTANKNPAETVKWLDYAYSEEGHMLFNFGVEGQTYNMENGTPVYTDLIMNNPDGLIKSAAMGKYIMALNGWPMAQDPGYFNQMMPDFSIEAINVWKNVATSGILPLLSHTPEEEKKVATIMTEINTYADEMFDKFVMGIESLDNYEKFVATLKQMKIDEVIAIKQEALDRYMKK